jgi:hypothetical protein
MLWQQLQRQRLQLLMLLQLLAAQAVSPVCSSSHGRYGTCWRTYIQRSSRMLQACMYLQSCSTSSCLSATEL